MCENFAHVLLSRLVGKIPDECLQVVSKEITVLLGDYDVTKRKNEIIPYTGLPEAYQAYMVSRKIEGRSEGTLRLYKIRLEDMLITIGKPVEDITANDLRIYLYGLQKRRGISDRTLDGVRLAMNAFFGWCATEGYCKSNVCAGIKAIKYEVKQREALTDTQLETLRNACMTDREKAIVEVMYSTGCRVSEMVGVKKSDVDFLTREVKLFGKGKKHRVSYLNAKADVALRKYLESRTDDNESLFVSIRKPHNALSRAEIEKIMRKIGDRAGIKNVFPHLMRHTFATNALAHGMPVTDLQKLLGHSKIDTTMIYAEVSQEEISQAHKRYVV